MSAEEVPWDQIRELKGDDPALIRLLEPKVLVLGPHQTILLAMAYLRVGRGVDASAVILDALNRFLDDVAATANLLSAHAVVLRELGQRDASVAAADRALSLLPDDPHLTSRRMDLDVMFGIPTVAGWHAARRALELRPGDRTVLTFAMRLALMTRHRTTALDLAMRLLKSDLTDAPPFARTDAHAVLAQVYATRFRLLRATRHAVRSLALAPERAFAREAVAVTLRFWCSLAVLVTLTPAFVGVFVGSGRPWYMYGLTYGAILFTTSFLTAMIPLTRPALRESVTWILTQKWMRPTRRMLGRCAAYLALDLAALAAGFPTGRIFAAAVLLLAVSLDVWLLVRDPKAYVRRIGQNFMSAQDAR